MEKKNPNIYQRALDIVNHRINPDIPQGGGGGSVVYIDVVLDTSTGELTSDTTLFDIQTAFNSGARVIAKVDMNGLYNMFMPLIAYTESAQAVPYNAAFGSYTYQPNKEGSIPLLEASIGMDGNTIWVFGSF